MLWKDHGLEITGYPEWKYKKKGNFFVSILILFGLFEKVKDFGIKNILQ